MIATCVYVACKTEECPQHIRTITSEAKSLWPEYISPDPTKIAECEFYLIEELESYLIVYHPYRSLMQISESLALFDSKLTISDDELQPIWSLINDSYATDMMLIYPPHIIATACVYVSLLFRSIVVDGLRNQLKAKYDGLIAFLGNTGIDVAAVVEAIQEMISLYTRWAKFEDGSYNSICRSILSKHLLSDNAS